MTEEFAKYFLDNSTKIISVSSATILSIAVVFDVGFFYGIDIHMFTLFSISEHVLFSIQWLPFSLALFCVGIVIVFVIAIETLNLKLMHSQTIYRYNIILSKYRTLIRVGFAAAIVVMLYLFYLEVREFGLINVLTSMLITMLCIFVAQIIVSRRIPYAYKIIISAALIYILMAFCAFVLGYLIGWLTIHENKMFNHRVITTSGDEIVGSIVRSGDKGVLFIIQNGERVFIKWEMLESVHLKPVGRASVGE